MIQDSNFPDWFAGLQALSQSEFPKRCTSCGRTYLTKEDFFRDTLDLRSGRHGLQLMKNNDASSRIELFRNCLCGSAMLVYFSDRRDKTGASFQRRQLFDELLASLQESGMQRELATAELLKIVHGQSSQLLAARYTSLQGKAE